MTMPCFLNVTYTGGWWRWYTAAYMCTPVSILCKYLASFPGSSPAFQSHNVTKIYILQLKCWLWTSLEQRLQVGISAVMPWRCSEALSALTWITSHIATMNKQHRYWSMLVLMLTTKMFWGLLLLKWLQLLDTVGCWDFLWSTPTFSWTHRWTGVLFIYFCVWSFALSCTNSRENELAFVKNSG